MSFHLLQVPHSFGLKLHAILYCCVTFIWLRSPPITWCIAQFSCSCLIQVNFLRSPQRCGITINCGPARCRSSLYLKPTYSNDFRRQKWTECGHNWGEWIWIGKKACGKKIVLTSYLQCPPLSVLFILGAQSIAIIRRGRGGAPLYLLFKMLVLMVIIFGTYTTLWW